MNEQFDKRAVKRWRRDIWRAFERERFKPAEIAAAMVSRTCVRRLIRDGTLAAIRDRGWRIRRRDLEQL